MAGNNFYKEIYSPEIYDREKSTRIMPDNLRRLGAYTLRLKMPPGLRIFGVDFVAVVTEEVKQIDDYYSVSFVLKPYKDREYANELFNQNGFMILRETDPTDPGLTYQALPGDQENGYFVGSSDPYDLALAELAAKSRVLVGAS